MRILSLTVLVALLIGCTKYRANEVSTTAPGTKPSCDTGQLSDELKKIASVTNGPVGAAFALLGTNEAASTEGTRHFPMQSVYKFPIAILVLRQVDAGK